MATSKRILFLLGPASLLWRELAQGFEDEGHAVFKIHFSLGDQMFWWRKGATPYRGRRSKFQPFLESFVEKNGITDMLYYGDRDFYHVIAQQVAHARGLTAISLENGYLRPDWMTLERGGMGVYSHFPDTPARLRSLAAQLPAPDLDIAYTHGFAREMFLEICYSMISYFWRVFYPFYRFGRYYDPLLEYLLAIPHMFVRGHRQRAANALIETLVEQRKPCFVVALQLQGDQQIRANSPYTHLSEFIEHVTASFAAHAERSAVLVFKQHPHDNHRESWARVVAATAQRHGVDSRTHFMDGGDLGRLLRAAKGCVIVNSTVGLFSLRLGCPTKVMGVAIYDIPGLTHSGTLDSFWRAPQAVDAALADDFVRVLAATIQVKGSFFDPAGRKAAVQEIVRRVAEGRVNEPGAFITPPPRIARAVALGIVPPA